jgi:hypothetical protein
MNALEEPPTGWTVSGNTITTTIGSNTYTITVTAETATSKAQVALTKS